MGAPIPQQQQLIPEATRALRLLPMTRFHLPWVVTIEHASYDFAWTEGMFHDCLAAGYSCWVLAESAQPTAVVRAHAVLSMGAAEAHLLNICVDPNMRRQQLGQRMLNHLFTVARNSGSLEMFLEVRPSNSAAMRMYEKNGFDKIAVRPQYYPSYEGREDAVIYRKML